MQQVVWFLFYDDWTFDHSFVERRIGFNVSSAWFDQYWTRYHPFFVGSAWFDQDRARYHPFFETGCWLEVGCRRHTGSSYCHVCICVCALSQKEPCTAGN